MRLGKGRALNADPAHFLEPRWLNGRPTSEPGDQSGEEE